MDFSLYAPAAQEMFEQGAPIQERNPEYYDTWWKTQTERCITGYRPNTRQRWIPGNYYFHLNFGRILRYNPKRRGKTFMPPLHRDMDEEYFMAVHEAREQHKGLIVMKARRKGFSINNSSILLHEWLFFPGSECGIGAYTEGQVSDFRNKLLDFRSKLPVELSHRAQPDDDDLMEAAHKIQNPDGSWKVDGSKSRIYFRNFGGNKTTGAGAFRGLSLTYLLIEEAGENPILENCFLSSEECFKEGELMYGCPIIGGTSNQINNKTDDFERLYYNAEKYNLIPLFIPASKVYYPYFDEKTGKSDVEAATKVIEVEHAQKAQLENKTSYYTALQEKPLKIEHCFMSVDNGKLPLAKINEQIAYLDTHESERNKIKTGNLRWKNGKYDPNNPQVEYEPDPLGKFRILEPPINHKYKNLDIGGVDTYFYNSAPTSDSMGSCFIYRRYCPLDSSIPQEMPVAEYTFRETTTDEFYDNCLKLAVYYQCKLLVEYDESFGRFMYAAKAIKYFRERPQSADAPGSVVSNRFMIHMKAHQKNLATKLLRDYCSTHVGNIKYLSLLKELKEYGRRNTDRVMAFALCLIHDLDNSNSIVIDQQKESENKGDFIPYFSVDRNGNLVSIHYNE